MNRQIAMPTLRLLRNYYGSVADNGTNYVLYMIVHTWFMAFINRMTLIAIYVITVNSDDESMG